MPEPGGRHRHDPFDAGFGPGAGESGGPDAAEAWRALRDGLNAASAHAGHGSELRCVELCPICRAVDVLRAGSPPELRGQINDFQREALLTLRSLLDHYLDRLDADPPRDGGRVEEIPID